MLANVLKRLAGKVIEALPAIVGSVVDAILSFVGFIVEHTWALIVFVAGLVGWWLMQKVKKSYVLACDCLPMHLDRSKQLAKSLGGCAVKYASLCGP